MVDTVGVRRLGAESLLPQLFGLGEACVKLSGVVWWPPEVPSILQASQVVSRLFSSVSY